MDASLEQDQNRYKICTDHIVRLSIKAQEAKVHKSDQNYLNLLQEPYIECLIVQLIQLLGTKKEDAKMLLSTQLENSHISKPDQDPRLSSI